MTRVLFFSGKGGVGKTTVAAATALALARRGHRTLAVMVANADASNEVLVARAPGAADRDVLHDLRSRLGANGLPCGLSRERRSRTP